MVRGRCIVRSGVGFRGDVGPNAPVHTHNESAERLPRITAQSLAALRARSRAAAIGRYLPANRLHVAAAVDRRDRLTESSERRTDTRPLHRRLPHFSR